MQPVRLVNMTNLYKRDIMIYALADFRFKKPVKIMVWVYFLFTFLILGFPLLKIFGFSKYTLMIAVVLPYALAQFMAKPIFNGRPFFSAVSVHLKYLFNEKIYYDNKPSRGLKDYDINEYHLISRKKDYQELFKMKYLEKKGVLYE